MLSSASDILIRLKELAIQAANDTLSGTDRDIIAAEAKNLRDELCRLQTQETSKGTMFLVVAEPRPCLLKKMM